MTTMTARYPGVCQATGQAFEAGATIEYNKAARSTKLIKHAPAGATPPVTPRPGRFARYGSNYTRFSGGAEAYTNKRGRCEDAPCCGCCS